MRQALVLFVVAASTALAQSPLATAMEAEAGRQNEHALIQKLGARLHRCEVALHRYRQNRAPMPSCAAHMKQWTEQLKYLETKISPETLRALKQ
jgi:hypothetical protein